MSKWVPGEKELQTRSLARRWTDEHEASTRMVEPRGRTRPSMAEVAASLGGKLIMASELERAPEVPLGRPPVTAALLEDARAMIAATASLKSSEGSTEGRAVDRRKPRSAGNCRPANGGKVEASDGEPLPIGPQAGVEPGPSDSTPRGKGRPKKDEPGPWVELGISKRTYYRKKKAGEI